MYLLFFVCCRRLWYIVHKISAAAILVDIRSLVVRRDQSELVSFNKCLMFLVE